MAEELEGFYKAVDNSHGLWKTFQSSGVKAPNLTPLQTYDIRFSGVQENHLYSFELAWAYGQREKNFWINDSVMSGVAAIIGAITHFPHQGKTNGTFSQLNIFTYFRNNFFFTVSTKSFFKTHVTNTPFFLYRNNNGLLR